jgi:serine phosphatase RsbU (regulator of sigma subunit)
MVYVRDQDRSLEFYRDRLGFTVVADYRFASGDRFVLVEPPDGTTGLALIRPRPGSPNFERIGQLGETVLVTDDIHAQYSAWRDRGVQFLRAPRQEIWGGVTASFCDVDGNVFILAGWDAITREVEARRRVAQERLEAERRAATELALAREVQARLFPQVAPHLSTLEYAGVCVQARAVGGDYYDFLNLGPGCLGLVVGDVSGKGIAAALMMSNLQANLRSQCAVARYDLARALNTVSSLFYENSPDAAFATLFFAVYDDELDRLIYANCGHPSALLVRRSGSVRHLASTAPVLGLFPNWRCAVDEFAIEPDETLVIFSDGVPEAFNAAGEEFGNERLISVVTEHRADPPRVLVDAVLGELNRFGGPEQSDDITLVVARRSEP